MSILYFTTFEEQVLKIFMKEKMYTYSELVTIMSSQVMHRINQVVLVRSHC